ncbi:RNA chaperone Hfq [Paraburkholderia sp. GAS199]|uniref:RNA chaperone Hfq n=1 Tax=Paraburkholderia sp. GAS199 TaxID=3035126 RepID=UPI003D1D4596
MSEVPPDTDTDTQTQFLRRAGGRLVWIFLISGIRLTGKIVFSDRYTIFLQSPHGVLVIFKHAIASVSEPHAPLFTPRKRSI